MPVTPDFFRDELPEEARGVITTAMESMMRKDAPFKPGFLIFPKALVRVCEKYWLSADAAKPPTVDELCGVIADSPYFEFLNGGGDSAERMAAMHLAQAEEYGASGLGLAARFLGMPETENLGSGPHQE